MLQSQLYKLCGVTRLTVVLQVERWTSDREVTGSTTARTLPAQQP